MKFLFTLLILAALAYAVSRIIAGRGGRRDGDGNA